MALKQRLRRVAQRLIGEAEHDAPSPVPDLERLLLAVGRMEARYVRSARLERLRDAEFRIFSQFGEDGIIQHLLGRVPIENETFVEFGVEDYRESNTRFLLYNDDWSGLVLDAGNAHIDFIRHGGTAWRHRVDARSAFITTENIDRLLSEGGFAGDLGLLSVDIDGNDYWILDAITVVHPRILIVEYNSTFGPDALVSVPYDPAFDRTAAHFSNLYWGASLGALCHVAARKGFAFVGSNSAGNNAFFVRSDVLGDLKPLTPREGWVDARFRESRDEAGNLTLIGGRAARVAAIGHLPLVDVHTKEMRSVSSTMS